MPLVKGEAIVEDTYLRVADDATIPDDGAVIVPGARLLAEPDTLSRRTGPTGVLWPNDRNNSHRPTSNHTK